jgi:hypothetical protein
MDRRNAIEKQMKLGGQNLKSESPSCPTWMLHSDGLKKKEAEAPAAAPIPSEQEKLLTEIRDLLKK